MIYDNRSMVRVTHKPSGRTVEVRDRSIKRAKDAAIRWLRSLVVAERHAPQSDQKVIRKYDIGAPGGAFIRGRDGKRLVEGDDEVLAVLDRGELERLNRGGAK